MSTIAPTAAARQGEAAILLESGTNELEVLVFSIGDTHYGVNVAKVREVILPVAISASPQQPDSVLGMFNLRNKVLPLIDLRKYLKVETQTKQNDARIIVTEFNGTQTGFLVDGVEQIYRMSWTLMKPVPETYSDSSFAITGITEIDGRLILMLDFESVLDQVSLENKLHIEKVENKLGVNRGAYRIFVAEDSRFIRQIISTVLGNSGYKRIETFDNGQKAWEAILSSQESGDTAPAIVLTDIEMPQMDGLALTRRIKQDARTKHIPVVLFSSLVTADTLHKGKQVGADEQLSKPQLAEAVEYVDRCAHKLEQGRAAGRG